MFKTFLRKPSYSKSSLQRRPLHRQSRYHDQFSENGWFALQNSFLTTATTPDTTTSQIGKVSLYSVLVLMFLDLIINYSEADDIKALH